MVDIDVKFLFLKEQNIKDNASFQAYLTDKTCVVGFDIYHYSQMEDIQQVLLPFVTSHIVKQARERATVYNGFLFKEYNEKSPIPFIDTGDGGFFLLRNPLEGIALVICLRAIFFLFNIDKSGTRFVDLFGTVDVRFAMTYDKCYRFQENSYGPAIINCARILSKDKLNRFLIDGNSHLWFMHNTGGVMSLPRLQYKQILKIEDFHKYSLSDIGERDDKTFCFNSSNGAVLTFAKESKCDRNSEKNTILDYYNVYLQVEDTDKDESVSTLFDIGNDNSNGI